MACGWLPMFRKEAVVAGKDGSEKTEYQKDGDRGCNSLSASGVPLLQVEPISENRRSAIRMSAAAFLPNRSISFRLLCRNGRAHRGRSPALSRDHFHVYRARRFRGAVDEPWSPAGEYSGSVGKSLLNGWRGEGVDVRDQVGYGDAQMLRGRQEESDPSNPVRGSCAALGVLSAVQQ